MELIARTADALSSRPRRFGGGRIGSFVGSNGGGSFLSLSTEEVLVLDDAVRDWVRDIADTVEPMDELDACRASCVDPFLGGSAGDVSNVVRPGSIGGSLRAEFGGAAGAERGLSLSIGGGGRRFFLTPTGKSFVWFVTDEPYVGIGGLFTVCTRVGAAGRFFEVGTGGGGLLPNV